MDLQAPGIQPTEPAAPVAPAEPVAPVAPTEPVAPVEPNPAEAAQAAEDAEWDAVTKDLYPGLTPKKEDAKDEPTKPEEAGQTPEAGKPNPADQAQDAKPGAGNDTPAQGADPKGDGAEPDGGEATPEAEEEAGAPDFDAINSRVNARESARQLEAVKNDVREKMFADRPTELRDASGDPIRTIQDVMGLVNPLTGQAFTEEEAGQWLLAAQQQLNQDIANDSKVIDQIAETNVSLKDQVDVINYRFGELLKENPEIAQEIWEDFEQTLKRDPKTNIIIEAPVSMERFYNRALKPYVEMAIQAEEAQAAAAAAAAAAAQQTRQVNRSDRSDIYTGGKTDVEDPEEKEWADAAKAVFG